MSTKEKGLRVNERIRAERVRLVAEDGRQIGIVSVEEALQAARDAHLDLVEVAPEADPPVCRIMNYGRYKYEHKQKTQKKHHVSKLKELRLHPKTEKHDVEVRLRQARKFLERGDRVLVNMIFRGRELSHVDLGRRLLEDFAAQLADIGKVEKMPTMENRRMGMILVHHKGEPKRAATPAPAVPPSGAPSAPKAAPSAAPASERSQESD